MINNFYLELKDLKIASFKESNSKLEVFLEKQTSKETCPNCHTISSSIKDHDYCPIIDKPIDSIPMQLIIKKKRFSCNNPACSRKSFTEEIPGLLKNSSYTQNFKLFLSQLYQDMDMPTIKKHLVHKYNLNIPLSSIHYFLKNTPIKEVRLFPSHLNHPTYIGIDEFSYAKGHSYAVILINIDFKKIIDIVAGGKTTQAALSVLNSIDTSNIKACSIDMWLPYKNACYKKLPSASVVVDKFHIIKHINEAIEKVRKRISLSLNKTDDSFLYQHRFILLTANENLSDYQRTKLPSLLSINDDLTKAYQFKELFRSLYLIHDPKLVHPQLWNWISISQHSNIPEFEQIGNSFASEWFSEIFNYWHHRISNAITEGKINKIRTIQRKAYHYRNFNSLRYQILKSEL